MRWYQRFFRRELAEKRLDAELRFHIEQRIADLVDGGMTAEEARRRARIEFGGIDQVKEECRDVGTSHIAETVIQDLRYGLRQLRRNPGFTIVAVLTLALGIGANTAIFTVVDAVLLRPMPGIDGPSRLISLYRMQKNAAFNGLGYPDYADYRDRAKSLSGLAASNPVSLSMSLHTPERIIGSVVTGNYFGVLGVRPERGRLILPADDSERNSHPVAVLSYALWNRKFGADPAAVGKKIVLNGHPFTIVGVAPPAFTGTVPGYPIQVWVPLSMLDEAMPSSVGRHYFDERAWGWLDVFGRLKPAVTFQRAETEMKAIAAQLAVAYPNTNAGRTVAVTRGVGLDPEDRASLNHFLGLMFAGVGLLLLIACSNVAGMLLARGAGRQREVAVRLALGAPRRRLVRQGLTEGLLLGLMGGACGLLLAPCALKMAINLLEPASVVRRADLGLNGSILAFSLLAALLTGALSSIVPALRASSTDLTTSLKEGTPWNRRARSPLQNALVIGQVALSFVLMMAAGLLVQSLRDILRGDPGFNYRNVFLARMDLNEQSFYQGRNGSSGTVRNQDGALVQSDRSEAFYRQLVERLQTVPGAVSATLASAVPPNEWPGAVSVFRPGEEPPQNVLRGHEFTMGTRVNFIVVAPNYFRTLGIPLLQGRDFTKEDDLSAPGVAIVSRNLADRMWPRENAIGKLLSWPTVMGPPRAPLEVVGVVGNCRFRSLVGDAPLIMFVPLFQNYSRSTTIAVRTKSSPMSMLASVRSKVNTLDKDLPIFGIETMQEQANYSLWQQRMAVGLISAFGVLALFLASLGLYSVTTHSLARRTHEIGIRMAFGAQRSDVLRMVVGQGLQLALVGVGIGLLGALAATRILSSMLFGVKPTDPLTFIVVPLILLAVALLACYIPARRAAKVDPMVALRYE